MPTGSFQVSAIDPATGNQRMATGQLVTSGTSVTVNVNLIGIGVVVVTVTDSMSNPVPGAQVVLQSAGGSVYFQQTGSTASNGTVTFPDVLAEPFMVTATDLLTGLNAAANGTVSSGATTSVAVQLQAGGTIAGVVRAADQVTPVPNVTVQLFGYQSGGGVSRQTTSAADGSFQFTSVPPGSYQLEAVDSFNAIRACASPFCSYLEYGTLAQNGREIDIAPKSADTVQVNRRIFVPSVGGYARYLEVITNNSSLAIPLSVTAYSYLNSNTNMLLVSDPATNGNTFAVTQDSTGATPVVGFVFDNAGAATPSVTPQFTAGSGFVSYSWNVTAPAGQSIILNALRLTAC